MPWTLSRPDQRSEKSTFVYYFALRTANSEKKSRTVKRGQGPPHLSRPCSFWCEKRVTEKNHDRRECVDLVQGIILSPDECMRSLSMPEGACLLQSVSMDCRKMPRLKGIKRIPGSCRKQTQMLKCQSECEDPEHANSSKPSMRDPDPYGHVRAVFIVRKKFQDDGWRS